MLAIGALLLLALTLVSGNSNADNSNNNYAQQSIEAYGGQAQASGGNSYNGDQQQHQAPTKAKKIQIVYIKVPLAKLKPSMANSDAYGANQTSYGTKGEPSK